MHCLSLTLVYRGTYIRDPRCQDLRWAHMWLPLIIANSVSAAFMKAWVHLPIRSNQPVSQSWLTVGGASSLCQWSVLLPHDYRCDLSHLSPSMRQLSTFLIQTIIAWFSNGFKCKCSELCCGKKKKKNSSARARWARSRSGAITAPRHLIKPRKCPFCCQLSHVDLQAGFSASK